MKVGIEADTTSLILLRHDAQALHIKLKPGSRSTLAGSHISRFRGRGMDFVESRVYMPGDDVRTIDWRVTARSGKPHTKVYVEERERPVFVLIDFSTSMFFGTRIAFKSVIAARIAALFTWLTIQQGDRIGGVFFTPDLISEVKPRSGRHGALMMIHSLAKATHLPQKNINTHHLSTLLLHASRVIHPGSLVILISDFYNIDKQAERHLKRVCRHNDFIACQILDSFEATLPKTGSYPITDGLNKTIFDLRSRVSRQRYQQLIEQRNQHLLSLLNVISTPLLALRTDHDLPQQLRQYLTGRKKHA